jgi:hypothetical protein
MFATRICTPRSRRRRNFRRLGLWIPLVAREHLVQPPYALVKIFASLENLSDRFEHLQRGLDLQLTPAGDRPNEARGVARVGLHARRPRRARRCRSFALSAMSLSLPLCSTWAPSAP